MKVTIEIGKDFPTITGAQSDAFARELLKLEESDFKEVILDFANTEVMSSMAVGSLFVTYQKLKEQNRTLKIINPENTVKRLLKMVNLEEMIDESGTAAAN